MSREAIKEYPVATSEEILEAVAAAQGGENENAAPAQSGQEVRDQLETRAQAGARWFYWVAALSVLNSIIMLFNGSWGFLFGLSGTQFVDALAVGIAQEAGEGIFLIKAVGFAVSAAVAGLFALIGRMALQGRTWAFALGTVFFSFDAFLSLVFQDYLGLAFHAWVLFSLVMGARACYALARQENPRA